MSDLVVHPLAPAGEVTARPLQSYALAFAATATGVAAAASVVIDREPSPPTGSVSAAWAAHYQPPVVRPPARHVVRAAARASGVAGLAVAKSVSSAHTARATGTADVVMTLAPFGRWADEDLLLDLI